MCSPTAVMVAVTAFQGFSQWQQGRAAAKAETVTAANNQRVANFNAGIKEREAADAVARGAEGAWQERVKAVRANARLRANLGGLSDTGTSLQLQGQNAGMGEVNALTVLNNAEREAYGHKLDAQSIRFGAATESANARYRSSIMKQNALLTGLGTFATGMANYGSSKGWFSGSSSGGSTYYPGSRTWVDWR